MASEQNIKMESRGRKTKYTEEEAYNTKIRMYKKYNREHSERIREYKKRYYEKNRERLLEQQKQYDRSKPNYKQMYLELVEQLKEKEKPNN